MAESRIGRLLRAYGVDRSDGTGISIREAARRTGLSPETLAVYMRDVEPGTSRRRLRPGNMAKIANGLKIPIELLRREVLADEGQVQAVTDEDVAGIMLKVVGLSDRDRARLIEEIARLQQSGADGE